MQLLRTRSREAFGQLYARYAAPLYGVIRNVVPDEAAACRLLESTFVAIWNRLDECCEPEDRLLIWMLGLTHAETGVWLATQPPAGRVGESQRAGLVQAIKTERKHEYPGLY